jgi:hypothetical protein
MTVEISEAELNTRKSGGVVVICRSCKDNKNKIVMIDYKQSTKDKGVHYQFCNECMQLMGMCIPCNAKKKLI